MSAIGRDARLLSEDRVAKWLLEDFPFRIQLASIFPFFPVSGHELRYANTKVLTASGSIGFGGGIGDQTSHPISPNRLFPFAELATQFRVDYLGQDVFSSSGNDQAAVQMALAIRRLLYRFWTSFEQGDSSNGTDFDGLLKLVDPSRVVDLEGRPLTLEALDFARELVRTNDGRGIVAYTSSIGKRAINAAHWVRGVTPAHAEFSFPSADGGSKREHVLVFDGAAVYVCDLNQQSRFDPDDSSVTLVSSDSSISFNQPGRLSNIWFLALGRNNLHGITPSALGETMFVVRSTILPDGSTLVYHVTMPTGIAVGTRSSVSVVKNAAIPVTSS